METEITREDFLNFNKHVLYKNRLKRSFLIASIFIVLWIIILNYGKPIDILKIVTELVVFYAGWTLLIIVSNQLSLHRIKKMPDSNGNILGLKTYSLDENGFKEVTKTSETLTNWNGIKEIQEIEDYYFIFIDKIAAYIIPKRDFVDNNEEEVFIRTIKENMNK